jgi:allantoinase
MAFAGRWIVLRCSKGRAPRSNWSPTSEQYYHSVIDQFETLYADSEKQPRVMGIPLHPMISGQLLRIKYLQRAIAEMKNHERVWFATGSEIIDAYQQVA